jgi:hypothetical protein
MYDDLRGQFTRTFKFDGEGFQNFRHGWSIHCRQHVAKREFRRRFVRSSAFTRQSAMMSPNRLKAELQTETMHGRGK